MKTITGPADVKTGDRVQYSPHYRKPGKPFVGTVVAVDAEKLTVCSDLDGKKRAILYAVEVVSNEFRRTRSAHHNFSLLDEYDLWWRERPASPLSAKAGNRDTAYEVSRVALIDNRDAVIAEIDALRAWLVREPKRVVP